MSEQTPSPFAEKMTRALEGHSIPKVSNVEEPTGLRASTDTESIPPHSDGREEVKGSKTGPVSSGAVHQRARLPETSTSISGEVEPAQMAEILLVDIRQKFATLKAVEAFVDAAGFRAEGDGELKEVIAQHMESTEEIVQSKRDKGGLYTSEDVNRLRAIQVELLTELTEMRAALEELQGTGELVLSQEMKAFLNTGLSITGIEGNGADKLVSTEPGTEEKGKKLPKPVVETEPSEDVEARDAQLKELVERWKTLRSEFPSGYLLSVMKKRWKGDIPMEKAGEWLKSGMEPKKWNKEKRTFFVEQVLRPMEEWVARAEVLAKALREKAMKVKEAQARKKTGKPASKKKSPSPLVQAPVLVADQTVAPDSLAGETAVVAGAVPAAVMQPDPAGESPLGSKQPVVDPDGSLEGTTVREIRTGRTITSLEDLTAWERIPAGEQKKRREMLRALTEEYMKDMFKQLQGIDVSSAETAEAIAQSLRDYLLEAIPIKIPDIELTTSDKEILVAELMADVPMIKSA